MVGGSRYSQALMVQQMGPLNAGVNLLWCRPGQVGGAEEYLVRQLAGLTMADPAIRVTVVAPPGFVDAHPSLASQVIIVTGHPRSRSLAGRLLEEVRWLPSVMDGMDLVHHGNATAPFRSPGPIVLTVHDLQHRFYPRYFSATRLAYLHRTVPRSVRQAAVVCVPSEFVRSTITAAYDVDPALVHVVPHGVPPPRAIPDESDLRRRYALGSAPVLLYPAATFPHKRHDFLIALLRGPLRETDLSLVLIGGRGRAESLVMQEIGRSGMSERIHRLGRVPDGDRDGLMAIAEAVVFPSEYEGFGAPVIEAMAIGTPVVCSDAAALPEVAGDAAAIAALDLEGWEDAIHRVRAHRNEFVRKGRERASLFTVQRAGEALARAYRVAAA